MADPDEHGTPDVNAARRARPSFASRRLSFGAQADAYSKFRPGYSREVVEWLLGHPAPGRHIDVLDLATGTGQLAAAASALGHRVTAVEPDAAMRARAASVLGDVPLLAGTAEQLPLEDASFDVVTVGTAWHWFDESAAAREIARVLRPHGQLSVVWNLRDDRVPWVAAFDDIVDGQDRVLRAAEVRFTAPADFFATAAHTALSHEVEMAPEDLVGLASSFSYVSLRPDAALVLDEVKALAETHQDLRGRASIAMPYVAEAYRCTKL